VKSSPPHLQFDNRKASITHRTGNIHTIFELRTSFILANLFWSKKAYAATTPAWVEKRDIMTQPSPPPSLTPQLCFSTVVLRGPPPIHYKTLGKCLLAVANDYLQASCAYPELQSMIQSRRILMPCLLQQRQASTPPQHPYVRLGRPTQDKYIPPPVEPSKTKFCFRRGKSDRMYLITVLRWPQAPTQMIQSLC
jgi:hypothetical protein